LIFNPATLFITHRGEVMIHTIKRPLKKFWLTLRLRQLYRHQRAIDSDLRIYSDAYQKSLEALRIEHEKKTDMLAAKRTAIRSALIRV
jgi:hypothetical protein